MLAAGRTLFVLTLVAVKDCMQRDYTTMGNERFVVGICIFFVYVFPSISDDDDETLSF